MKLLSLNTRGLGGRFKWKELRKVIQAEKADFVCLQEKKGNKSQISCV